MTNSNCVASIDLGTNSCRLMICDDSGKCLHKENVSTRLGEGMYPELKFTDEAIERGVKCFAGFKSKIDELGVKKCRAIATHACRVSLNAQDFLHKVWEASGINIEVIDGLEEARLNLKGAIQNADKSKKYVVVYDLGGGSTEITLATNTSNPEIIYTVSIPWGARNSAEAFDIVEYDAQKAQKLEHEIKRWVDGFVLHSNLDKHLDDISFVATSSSPLRLVAMNENFEKYDREKADGHIISKEDMDKIIAQIHQMSQAQMAQSPYIGEKRSYIFVAATIVFKTIYDGLKVKKLVASLKSAKDGIIEELLENGKTS